MKFPENRGEVGEVSFSLSVVDAAAVAVVAAAFVCLEFKRI